MTATSIAVMLSALAHIPAVKLISYRQVWLPGGEYVYECRWSDGAITTEHTLPWGNLP